VVKGYADYKLLITTIKVQLGPKLQPRDLVISELTLIDEVSFKPEFLERWPEIGDKNVWTFSLPRKQVIEMAMFVCESHWERVNYGL